MTPLTAKQAAERLGVGLTTVYALFHAGEVGGYRVGTAVRIHRDSLAAYVAAHSNGGKDVPPTRSQPPSLSDATTPRGPGAAKSPKGVSGRFEDHVLTVRPGPRTG